jgi:hypothetical protein
MNQKDVYNNGIVDTIKKLLNNGKIELHGIDETDKDFALTGKHSDSPSDIRGAYWFGTNKKNENVFELFIPYSTNTWGKPLSAVLNDKTCKEHSVLKVNSKVINIDFNAIYSLYEYIMNDYQMRSQSELEAIMYLSKQYE